MLLTSSLMVSCWVNGNGYCRVQTGWLSTTSTSHRQTGAQWKICRDAAMDLNNSLDLGLQLRRPRVQMHVLRSLFLNQRDSRDPLRSGDHRFPRILFLHHQCRHLTVSPGYATLQQVCVEQLRLPANHDAVVAWSHSLFHAVWPSPRHFQLVLLPWE